MKSKIKGVNQMAGDIRYVIVQEGSDPVRYFQTKGRKREAKKRTLEDITIHPITGFWGGSESKARRYLHDTKKLPNGCTFRKVGAGTTESGLARARKRAAKIPF